MMIQYCSDASVPVLLLRLALSAADVSIQYNVGQHCKPLPAAFRVVDCRLSIVVLG